MNYLVFFSEKNYRLKVVSWLGIASLFWLTGCNTMPIGHLPNASLSSTTAQRSLVPPSASPPLQPTQPSLTPSALLSFEVRSGLTAHVLLQETVVLIQTTGVQVQLETLYLPLYQTWHSIYFKVGDFDGDGLKDLAILQSVDVVGQQRCYAIYRYNPALGRFREQKSFDYCQ